MNNGRKHDKSNIVYKFVPQSIDDNQRRELLHIAREAIKEYLGYGFVKPQKNLGIEMTQIGGVFVTLWSAARGNEVVTSDDYERLRGCVGRVGNIILLVEGIQESAVSAATRDPRFSPITIAELGMLRIEIAILSPLRAVNSLTEIVIGEHGLMIEGQNKRGLLLPKVAVRMGWSRHSFLQGVCEKASLPHDSWPERASLFSFTTVVVEE